MDIVTIHTSSFKLASTGKTLELCCSKNFIALDMALDLVTCILYNNFKIRCYNLLCENNPEEGFIIGSPTLNNQSFVQTLYHANLRKDLQITV